MPEAIAMIVENSCALLEEFFLPPVENRGMKTVFVAQIRNRSLLQEVLFENLNFFPRREILALLGHGMFLRN